MKKTRAALLFMTMILAALFAFTSCVGANNNNKDDEPEVDEASTEGVLYEIAEHGEYASVIGYEGKSDRVVISSTYEGLPVQIIADGAFEGMNTIIEVSMPATILEIGERAFASCEWLSKIEIPSKVGTVGASAFENCTSLEEVTLPASLNSIGGGAFAFCSKLDRVHIQNIDDWFRIEFADDTANPLSYADKLYVDGYEVTELTVSGSVKSISRYALSFRSLEKLTVSIGVNEIAQGALSECTSLAELSVPYVGGGSDLTNYLSYLFGATERGTGSELVPNTLTTVTVTGSSPIGSKAFYGIRSISSVELGSNVKSIGSEAFYGCSALAEFTVPENATEIGFGAFAECNSLKVLNIPFVGGSLTENRYLGYIFGSTTPEGSSKVIPLCLYELKLTTGADIAENAFAGASDIRALTVNKSTKLIGFGALSGCTSLVTLKIPFAGGSSTANTYFGYVFGAASPDENGAKVPDTLSSVELTSAANIGESAFAGCSSLKAVGILMGTKSIGANAFSGCSGLVSALIPYTVETIGANAFNGYSQKRIYAMASSKPSGWSSSWKPYTVKVSWGSSYTGTTDDGFTFSQTLDEIEIIGYTGGLSDVIIPYSIDGVPVVGIGSEAFLSNVDLKSIYLHSSITKIDYKAFSGCYNLTSITLPENLTIIGEGAFYGCGFTELVIPKSVTQIGPSAISYCSNLKKLVIEDGSKLSNVGSWAFKMNQNMTEVYIDDLAFWCSISFADEYSNPLIYAKKFYVGGELISTISIPTEITEINPFSFTGTIPRVIILHSGITKIGSSAFVGCTSLAGIYLHDGITEIGENAFFGCSRLTVFSASADAPATWHENWNYSRRPVIYGCIESGITYDGLGWVKLSESAATIYGYTGAANVLSIPESIGSVPVTEISAYAFRGITSLKKVLIPASVTSISGYAFYECSSLNSVIFDDADGWKYYSSATSTSGTELPSEELKDQTLAAEYLTLTSKYTKYYWHK